jgi:transposase InsO family protein
MKEIDIAKEIYVYRQQLSIYKNKKSRYHIPLVHKLLWIYLSKTWDGWQKALAIVQPDTVTKWYRSRYKLFWRRISTVDKQIGRPTVNVEVQRTIRRISRENPNWGNKRIRDELTLLRLKASIRTIAKYRSKIKKPPSQSWKTFVKNHMHCSISMDLFGVPDVRFRMLYGFVIIDHARRKVLTLNSTLSPTSQWVAQQIKNAFFELEDDREIKYIIHDRDPKFLGVVPKTIESCGLKRKLTARASPWQNAYAERVIGSIRRELLNNVIVFGNRHLQRLLREYQVYYNEHRTHQGIGGNSPIPRDVQSDGEIVKVEHMNGLLNSYRRAA